MKNRFLLALLTNAQSHPNGDLSDEKLRRLVMRAEGVFADHHIPGLRHLAAAIHAHDSLAIVQLHHAGLRARTALIREAPISPSGSQSHGARAMSRVAIDGLIADFIAAAWRAKQAGFDRVQVHGAHGYILGQFLSPQYNQRTDDYGGSRDHRVRVIVEIIRGIRQRCGEDFHIALRLSPERFGQLLPESITVAQQALNLPELDCIALGRAAILHHDFPKQVLASHSLSQWA